MKTNNPFFDNMIDAQTKTVNNWLDTTKKFQDAVSGGKIQAEAQSIYKDWMEKQMNIFGGSQTTANGENNSWESFSKPEEFFKNWYTRQSEQIKQMTEFNQNLYQGFMNYGRSNSDYMGNWNQMSNSWTNIYTNWMNTMNSTYEAMMKNMPNQDAQEAFKKFFEGNKTYANLQDFWSGVYKNWQNNEFSMDHFKEFMSADAYKKVVDQMFSGYFQPTNMKEVFEASMNNLNNLFSGNSNIQKEYIASFQNMANQFPQFMSGDFSKLNSLFHDMKNVFEKSFAPVMKMLAPGKEKQNLETTIKLMDNVALYSVKQAQFQQLFYVTSHKATENVVKQLADKMKQNVSVTEAQSFNDFYNEWLKVNESEFTKLYASDEFSKLKSELISINADVKSAFENQFQQYFSVYPVVFRSEMEELHKTIYDLKKQIKSLESKLNSESLKEDKAAKKK
ncbi:MAG: poly(R)-hydroxyalkanoic acid synthase subunit PhaE [Bacteroidota bacterium]